MTSCYEQHKKLFKSLCCINCTGDGELDDLEPGDISGNTWVCPVCNGTGYAPGVTINSLQIMLSTQADILHQQNKMKSRNESS